MIGVYVGVVGGCSYTSDSVRATHVHIHPIAWLYIGSL